MPFALHRTSGLKARPRFFSMFLPCRGGTSCPDQLSRAIEAYQQQA